MTLFKEFKQAFIKAFVETIVKNYGDQTSNQTIKKVKLEDKSWSVWVLETKEGIQLLSVQGYIDGAIPEDGSFISAFQLSSNMTEVEADQLVEKIAQEKESRIPF